MAAAHDWLLLELRCALSCHAGGEQSQQKASRFSSLKSLVVGGASSSGRADDSELLCERVLSTATGNWLSHLDWDGHRYGWHSHWCLKAAASLHASTTFPGPVCTIAVVQGQS